MLVKLLFVSRKLQHLGDVYIHICTHTHMCLLVSNEIRPLERFLSIG